MNFYENLSLLDLMILAITRKPGYFLKKSVAARLADAAASKLGIVLTRSEKFEVGHISTATNARQSAYKAAEASLNEIGTAAWAGHISRLLSIDVQLITRKHLFEQLYDKCLFLELILRYAGEHPQKRHYLKVEPLFLEPYLRRIRGVMAVSVSRNIESAKFYCAVLASPLLLIYHRLRNGTTEPLSFQNNLVCAVVNEATCEMFSRLFAGDTRVRYVVERSYVREFTDARLRELQIGILGLTREGYRHFRRTVFQYMSVSLRCRREMTRYGTLIAKILHVLLQGRALAINGTCNSFVTFEHLTTVRAARNEFLRAQGNRSVFVPKTSYVTYQQLPSEVWINYDVMCSPGAHAEDLYKRKLAVTKIFLRTGSYDAHQETAGAVAERALRRGRLESFKGEAQLITILSPGICDEIYSHEVRLMQLARELSKCSGVKVAVRPKPVPLIAKYRNFYESLFEGFTDLLLTGSEYDLFDFLGVTDLFVTSISTSACDVAMRGGAVMFVDFMQTPDLYLPWEKVKDVVLTEGAAFEAIIRWMRDGEGGPVRSKHAKAMETLASCLGYRFDSFESYKVNLLTALGPFLPGGREGSVLPRQLRTSHRLEEDSESV
jgi:hypothetical protein